MFNDYLVLTMLTLLNFYFRLGVIVMVIHFVEHFVHKDFLTSFLSNEFDIYHGMFAINVKLLLRRAAAALRHLRKGGHLPRPLHAHTHVRTFHHLPPQGMEWNPGFFRVTR